MDTIFFTTAPVRITTFDEITRIVQSVTGWNISFWEIMKAGERGVTMARCFNIKHGLIAKDDYLPDRLFQPVQGGPQEGSAIPKDVKNALGEIRKAVWDQAQSPIPEGGMLMLINGKNAKFLMKQGYLLRDGDEVTLVLEYNRDKI